MAFKSEDAGNESCRGNISVCGVSWCSWSPVHNFESCPLISTLFIQREIASSSPASTSIHQTIMSLQASRYLRSSSVASGGPKLVLGLSVSHSTTGFAMVRLHNGDALRFGVIDTRQAILDGTSSSDSKSGTASDSMWSG